MSNEFQSSKLEILGYLSFGFDLTFELWYLTLEFATFYRES